MPKKGKELVGTSKGFDYKVFTTQILIKFTHAEKYYQVESTCVLSGGGT